MTALESQTGARSAPMSTVPRRRILTVLGGVVTGVILAALDLAIVAAAVLALGFALSLTLRAPAARQPPGSRIDTHAETATTARSAAASAAPEAWLPPPVRMPSAAGDRAAGARVGAHGTGLRADGRVVPQQRGRG